VRRPSPRRCAIVSGPAPPEANISKDAMSPAIRILQQSAALAPRPTGAAYQAGLRKSQRHPDKDMAWMLRNLLACDVAVLERPAVRALVLAYLAAPLSATARRAGAQDIWSGPTPRS